MVSTTDAGPARKKNNPNTLSLINRHTHAEPKTKVKTPYAAG
jgi:hypothetical protein